MATASVRTNTDPEFIPVGENVTYAVVGDELVIKIDMRHRGQLSGSGKTTRVGTTNGNKAIGETGVVLGLNAYIYATPR
jgi:hypothetical protein